MDCCGKTMKNKSNAGLFGDSSFGNVSDDDFWLYDLKVEVVAGDRPMVCNHQAGDYFLVEGERGKVTQSSKHVALQTANGLARFDNELALDVDQLGLKAQTLVLDNSPDVLS